ncbi:MAG: hypothetical protein GKR99_14320 [Rhodobacteraceae bacterium]|nr:hypothetical protein [Paracoccaceae bacterium]
MIRLATTASLLLRCRREDGGMTIFGLYIFLGMAILAGIGVDFSNLIAHRTHLQVAADVAAHAAIVTRQGDTEASAKLKAIELATGTMPYSRHGNTLEPVDIHFGTWNRATQVFTPVTNSKAAVLVETSNLQSKSNPVSSFLLHLKRFDINLRHIRRP